jgi:ribosomal protein S18 acetylase RimI-like enzyme
MMSKDEEDVLIRDFKKSDLDNLLEVAKKSFAKEFEISGFDPDHIREMVNKMFSFWGKIILGFLKLMGKEPFKLFVAEADGKLVGTTMVNIKGKIGYIVAVMVHPIYRRKGIATKLMKNALNYTQKKKLSRAILDVVSTNIPAKGLYRKLGFEKFESVVHLVANINSLQRPQNVEDVQIRNFEKKDMEAVYDLIKRSEDPTHLKVFDFKKKDLEFPLIKRITRFTTDKKTVAAKNDRIVGYTEASYTTAEEAGRIRNIQLHPNMRSKGIEDILIYAGVDHIKNGGASRIIATALSTRQELVEKMKQLGFKKSLEMEGMVLEFKD